MNTCSHEGCTGRVVCVVQDVVKRRDVRTGRDVVEPDGSPKALCSKHSRKYHKRRGRAIGEDGELTDDPNLPF